MGRDILFSVLRWTLFAVVMALVCNFLFKQERLPQPPHSALSLVPGRPENVKIPATKISRSATVGQLTGLLAIRALSGKVSISDIQLFTSASPRIPPTLYVLWEADAEYEAFEFTELPHRHETDMPAPLIV